jgi:hypothetical protein
MSASSWRFEPRTGASLRTIALFWKEFSGSRERGRRGVTCPKSSANGRRSIASSGAGQALGRDTRGPERERSVPDALRMIDSTVVRAHHQAAGAKGGLRDRVSAVRAVASRPRSTSGSTVRACP